MMRQKKEVERGRLRGEMKEEKKQGGEKQQYIGRQTQNEEIQTENKEHSQQSHVIFKGQIVVLSF